MKVRFQKNNAFFAGKKCALFLPVELLKGDAQSWENGTILNTGALQSSTHAIRTDYISLSGKTMTFNGLKETANNVIYLSFVVEYDANKTFLRRSAARTSEGVNYNVKLQSDCRYVRIVYGHANATATQTPPSEGALCNFTLR